MIRKVRAQSPDPFLGKIKGDTEFARLAHLNNIVDQLNDSNFIGPQGPQGNPGPQGPQGNEGPQGIQGDTGAQGTAGNSVTILGSYPNAATFFEPPNPGSVPGTNIGDAYIMLDDGSLYSWSGTEWFDAGDILGPQGPQGPQGEQGVKGDQGLTGTQGLQGVPGTAATIAVGSTTTGAPGSNASVVNVGTSSAAIFNFTIPGSFVPVAPLVYGLYAQTADATPVTGIAEESLINGGVGTLTVPANGFSVGDSFRADLAGVMSAANNQTLTIKLKAGTGGSVTLFNSGAQNLGSAITSDVWSLSINFTVRALGGPGVASIVSLGTFNYAKTNNGSIEGFSFNEVNNTTFNTTVTNTLQLTAQWGAANASNTIYSDIFILNKIY